MLMHPLLICLHYSFFFFFFFNDTATTEIYTLSLHDALPISRQPARIGASLLLQAHQGQQLFHPRIDACARQARHLQRSEEHTSELQSPDHLVCRLLLEKKKNKEISLHLTCSLTDDDSAETGY